MKKVNFSEKSLKELLTEEKDARKALITLRVEKEQRKLKNFHQISGKKKELAKILTAIRTKELAK